MTDPLSSNPVGASGVDAGVKVEHARCEACRVMIPESYAHTDDDGFIGCRPCFPVSNRPEDSNRFLRGKCFRPRAPVETIPRLMDPELFRDLDDEARRR